MSELVVCGRAYIGGELKYSEIGITDGVIDDIGPDVRGEEKIDAGSSATILPGLIDPHVHFRDPGLTRKEDFSTGSLSAVCAGVTTVLDMPNTKPPVVSVTELLDKKRAIRGRSFCDYGLFAAFSPGCPVNALAPHVCGYKLFLGSTTGNILMEDEEEIEQLMQEASRTGKTVSVHAETDALLAHGVQEDCCMDHLRNRPAAAEDAALRLLSRYAATNRVNICHCTRPEQVREAKRLGFSTEVTMHHLLFDAERCTSALYKVNPPIREPAARKALYGCFLDGEPDMIGTDHAPHTVDEKEREFDAAPGGIIGVETTVPMLMRWATAGTITINQVVSMCAEKPSEVFGLGKGRIAVGAPADLAVFDLRSTSIIQQSRLHAKAARSPYVGMEAVFPGTVLVRGEIQVEDGEPCGEPLGRDLFV